MTEKDNHVSPLDQMNRILSEKEAVIDKKFEELKKYHQELKVFESQLSQKVLEVKHAQEEILKEKESIEVRWKQLKTYEEQLESSMSQVLAEKVLIEERSKSELEKVLNNEDLFGEMEEHTSEFDLTELRKSIGIDVPEFGTEEITGEKSVIEEVDKTEKGVPKFGTIEPVIPNLFLQMEKEITKSYSKWSRLEMLPERYCVQSGDKEIRFFDTDEKYLTPRIEIVVFRKNAKTDKRLMNNIAGIERVAPDWSIAVEENQIVCIMQFTAETKPSVVLKKCTDFMKNYLT